MELHFMRKCSWCHVTGSVLLFIFLLLQLLPAFAQKTDSASLHTQLREIDTLLKYSKRYVTASTFDSIFYKKQLAISGVQAKDGKLTSTAIVIQDKSATFTLASAKSLWRSGLYVQPSVTGTSTKNFISLFTDNKYQRTLTGGVNLQFYNRIRIGKLTLSGVVGGFDPTDQINLHNRMAIVRKKNVAYEDPLKADKETFLRVFEKAYPLYSLMSYHKLQSVDSTSAGYDVKGCNEKCSKHYSHYPFDTAIVADTGLVVLNSDSVVLFKKGALLALDTLYVVAQKLVTAGVLPGEWDDVYPDTTRGMWDSLRNTMAHTDLKALWQVNELKKIQDNAPWMSFKYSWFSGNVKLNHSTNAEFTPTAEAKDFYKRDVEDYYYSAQISYNKLRNVKGNWVPKRNEFRRSVWLHSLSFNINNSRSYESDSLMTLNRFAPYAVGIDTVSQLLKQGAMYNYHGEKKVKGSWEFSTLLFFPLRRWGIDLAGGSEMFPKWDKGWARAGVYITVGSGKEAVIVEPLLRVDKIGKKHLSFWQEQVSLGFSVSVTIPKYIATSKESMDRTGQ